MEIKPNWKHDCDRCVFLGLTIGGGRMTDLYYCPQGILTTLVARYGDDGPEYYSMPPKMVTPHGHSELFVARALYEESQNVPERTKK